MLNLYNANGETSGFEAGMQQMIAARDEVE